MYCCKTSETLGLPLCIICVLILSSLVLMLIFRWLYIGCCVVTTLCPLKELEENSDLFQYGGLQVKLCWESSHLKTQNHDERRRYRYTDDT